MCKNSHQDINDKLRKDMQTIYLSKGIQLYKNKDINAILTKVKEFDDFRPENDPEKIHNFGIFEYNGEKILWIIRTYYPNDVYFQKKLFIMKVNEC